METTEIIKGVTAPEFPTPKVATKITRRKFVRNTVLAFTGLCAVGPIAYLRANEAINIASITPTFAHPEHQNEFVVTTNWLRRCTDQPFIQTHEGYYPQLTEMAKKNPFLGNSIRDYFKYLHLAHRRGELLETGAMMDIATNCFRKHLASLDKKFVDPNINYEFQVALGGAATLAYTTAPWGTVEDKRFFGVTEDWLPAGMRVRDWHFRRNGLAATSFPRLFNPQLGGPAGVPVGENGNEHVGHLAGHYYATLRFLEILRNKLPDLLEVPIGFTPILSFSNLLQRPGSLYDQAIVFSDTLGWIYEAYGMIEDKKNMPILTPREKVKEGLFEITLAGDISTNRLGANIAIAEDQAINQGNIAGTVLKSITTARYERYDSPPILYVN